MGPIDRKIINKIVWQSTKITLKFEMDPCQRIKYVNLYTHIWSTMCSLGQLRKGSNSEIPSAILIKTLELCLRSFECSQNSLQSTNGNIQSLLVEAFCLSAALRSRLSKIFHHFKFALMNYASSYPKSKTLKTYLFGVTAWGVFSLILT